MKINISKADAEAFIRNQLGSVVTGVNIGRNRSVTTQPGPAQHEFVAAVVTVNKELNRDNTNKIACIKRLRELTGCGLAEAKFAVEFPREAIGHFIIHGAVRSQYTE